MSPTDSKAAQLAVFAAGRMTCLLEESQRAIAAKESRRASLRGPRQRPGEGHGLLQVNGLDGCPTDTSSRLITRCNFSSFYTPPRLQTPNDDTEPARSGQGVRDGGLADLCGNACLAFPFPSRRSAFRAQHDLILCRRGEASLGHDWAPTWTSRGPITALYASSRLLFVTRGRLALLLGDPEGVAWSRLKPTISIPQALRLGSGYESAVEY